MGHEPIISAYRERMIADVVTGKVDVRDASVPDTGEESVCEQLTDETLEALDAEDDELSEETIDGDV